MVESLYTQPYRPRQHIIIVQKFIYTTHNALYIQLVTIYLWGVLILSYNIFCLLLSQTSPKLVCPVALAWFWASSWPVSETLHTRQRRVNRFMSVYCLAWGVNDI